MITMLPIVAPHAVLTVSELKKGMSSARSDDTKSLKGSILDWIVPCGQSVQPPLACNTKTDLLPIRLKFDHKDTSLQYYIGKVLVACSGINERQTDLTQDVLYRLHITHLVILPSRLKFDHKDTSLQYFVSGVHVACSGINESQADLTQGVSHVYVVIPMPRRRQVHHPL